MINRSSVAFASAIFAFGISEAASADNAPCDFQLGQEWSVKSNADAKVVIGRVEDWRGENAVHVAITAIKIPAGSPGAGMTTEMAHVPFLCSSLQDSVDALLATGRGLPKGFEDGYQQWREARGGVFTISVNEVIELILKLGSSVK